MWINEFDDYKVFLAAVIKTYPNRGYGQGLRLAEHLRASSSVISQVLNGERHFTPEQALEVAGYFGFDDNTRRYFLLLVDYARAGTKNLRDLHKSELALLKAEAEKIKNLVANQTEVADEDKAIFYSNWYYAGVALLTSIEGFQTVDRIAEYFRMSRAKVSKIVSFALRTGFCVEEKGLLRMGTKSAVLDRSSEFLNNHRRNWRAKANEKFTEPGADEIFFSSPVSISEKDAEEFRKELLNTIQNFSKCVSSTSPEKLMCLNIDWFKF